MAFDLVIYAVWRRCRVGESASVVDNRCESGSKFEVETFGQLRWMVRIKDYGCTVCGRKSSGRRDFARQTRLHFTRASILEAEESLKHGIRSLPSLSTGFENLNWLCCSC
jgi:hypothetical protein